jgi:outer membrane immunogenic protein
MIGLVSGSRSVNAAPGEANSVLEKLAALEARMATPESENRDLRRRLARGRPQPVVSKDPTAAYAADLTPARMPPKAPAIVQQVGSWTGFYIGGNIGHGWGSYGRFERHWDDCDREWRFGPYGFNAASGSGNGVTAGILAGYNWQITQTVLGIEADWQYLDSKAGTANSAIAVSTFIGGNFSGSAGVSTNWYATFRGRVGYAFGPALLYATGGIALAETRPSANATGSIATSVSIPPTLGPPGSMSAFESTVLVGYAVGAGLEYAIAAGWSVKGEYLHMGFGTNGYNLAGSLQSPDGLIGVIATHVDVEPSFDIARVGVNYRF